jgi:hypothetical protein
MSKQTTIIIASVIAIILLAGGVYFFFFTGNDTTDLKLVSTEEAGVQELSEEARQFLESSGSADDLNIDNPVDDNNYAIATTEDKGAVIVVNDDQVIPLYNAISAAPIAEDKIVITTGEYDSSSPDNNALKGNIKAYIYDLNDQSAKVFFEPEKKVTDLFAMSKGDKIVLSLGNEVQVYNQQGELEKTVFTAEDDNEQLIIADQEGTTDNQFRIFLLGEGERVLEI